MAPAARRSSLRRIAVILFLFSGFAASADTPAPHNHKLTDKLLHWPAEWQAVGIVVGTLISEDLTCIAVGTLIHHHEIAPVLGVVSCFAGIYIGDLFFFFLGRLAGARLLQSRWMSKHFPPEKRERFGAWFDRRPWAAIAACRFLPGIRVPLYLTVGAVTRKTKTFFLWTCIFAFVWTPLLILLVVVLGDAFIGPFEHLFGRGWPALIAAIAAIFIIIKVAISMTTHEGRQKLSRLFLFWRRKPTSSAGGSPENAPAAHRDFGDAAPDGQANGACAEQGPAPAAPPSTDLAG